MVGSRVIEVGVDGYEAQRVLDHLLPLVGTTDAAHDVDPSSLEPVLLPVDKVGGRLSLTGAMAGCRKLGCLALAVVVGISGLGCLWFLVG